MIEWLKYSHTSVSGVPPNFTISEYVLKREAILMDGDEGDESDDESDGDE